MRLFLWFSNTVPRQDSPPPRQHSYLIPSRTTLLCFTFSVLKRLLWVFFRWKCTTSVVQSLFLFGIGVWPVAFSLFDFLRLRRISKSIFPSSFWGNFLNFSPYHQALEKRSLGFSHTEKKCIDIAAKNVHHIHKKQRKLLCLARFLICSNNMHTLFTFDCKIQVRVRFEIQIMVYIQPVILTLFEIFIFCPKIQLWFPEKIVDFLGEKLVKMLWFWTF